MIEKLLEVTHGQWLYRNVQVHDVISGTTSLQCKDNLCKAIEHQLKMGEDELEEEDRYLLDIDLDRLDGTSKENHDTWLQAITQPHEAVVRHVKIDKLTHHNV